MTMNEGEPKHLLVLIHNIQIVDLFGEIFSMQVQMEYVIC